MRPFRDMPFAAFLVRFGGRPETGGRVVDNVSVPAARYSWGIKSPKKINGEIMKMLSCCAYLRGRI